MTSTLAKKGKKTACLRGPDACSDRHSVSLTKSRQQGIMRQRISHLASAFLSTVPVPALVSTPLGEIVYRNQSWLTAFPIPSEVAGGDSLPVLQAHLSVLGMTADKVDSWIMQSLESEQTLNQPGVLSVLPLDNHPYTLSFSSHKLDGVVVLLVVGIPQEIESPAPSFPSTAAGIPEFGAQSSPVARHRAELERLREALETASSVGIQLMRGLGHEYRTPLSSILGLLEIALMKEESDEVRQILLQAQGSARDLLTIVTDVIDFANIDTGAIVVSPQSFSLKNIIDRILSLVSRKSAEKKLQIASKVAESIPSQVIADEQRIGQILLNTMLFILEHATPRGGIALYIDESSDAVTERDGSITVRVSIAYWDDTTAEGDVKRLFSTLSNNSDPISSSRALSRLRLSLVGRLLDQLGGSVEVRHLPRCGVRIEMLIPVGVNEVPQGNDKHVSHRWSGKVLVAEDNPINARVVTLMLEHLGVRFVLVRNGTEAIRAYEQDEEGFDLVLMDCQMPELDGFEATRAIRLMEGDTKKRTPIIAMTAYALPGDRDACLAAGMDGYLAKPLSSIQLATTLEAFNRG